MQISTFTHWVQQTTFATIPLWSLMLAVGVAAVAYLVMRMVLRVLTGRAQAWAARSQAGAAQTLLDMLGGTSRFLVLMVAVLLGAGMLELPGRWENRLGQLWFVAVALQLGFWGMRAITAGVRRYDERHAGAQVAQVSASATLMSWGLRTLLWSVVILVILSNVDVNITAFIASLGVGGIAVALAVQSILADLFASLAIAVDKPFEVGDFVVVGGVAGTVQMIGLKSTRIRSLQGEQVVMSNTDLLKQTINNYRLLKERRIVFGFGITFDATADQAEAVPAVVRKIIESHQKLRFDRAHFKAFGASSLDYEVVYIVEDPSFGVYMDMQQSINLALMREFKTMGLEFAFPTRTVHIATVPAQRPVALPAKEPVEPQPIPVAL